MTLYCPPDGNPWLVLLVETSDKASLLDYVQDDCDVELIEKERILSTIAARPGGRSYVRRPQGNVSKQNTIDVTTGILGQVILA